MKTKICKDCKEKKPITQFYPVKSTKDKLMSRCSFCHVKYNRAYKQGKIESTARTSAAQVGKQQVVTRYDIDEDSLGFIGSPLFERIKAEVLLYIEKKKKPCSMLDIRKAIQRLNLIDYRRLHNYVGEALRDLENTDIKRIEDFVDRWTLK